MRAMIRTAMAATFLAMGFGGLHALDKISDHDRFKLWNYRSPVNLTVLVVEKHTAANLSLPARGRR
ncbi:MAG: hypothetical protein OXC28_05560 [Defluviicoccus sp.]|nr:hypothetical protein [Defluviicoccus sp.]